VFAALLDTNVIWPSLRRDFLLSLAIEGLYRPLWSEAILEELSHHEQRKLCKRGATPAAAEVKAQRLIVQMRRAFPDAIVVGWEPLEGSYGLPDPDDEHVLAAAAMGGAGAIVTENAKDFPISQVPNGIQVISAAEFARNTVDLDLTAVLRALRAMSARYTSPARTLTQIVDDLESRYDMHDATEAIRACLP
jgi:predicted nucleic acid-binding protein